MLSVSAVTFPEVQLFLFAQGMFCFVCTILKRCTFSTFLILLMYVIKSREKGYISRA